MKLPLKCEQDYNPGQEGGHKHSGIKKMPGLCDAGTLRWGEHLNMVTKLPALPGLQS
jgi:hypothetical protein